MKMMINYRIKFQKTYQPDLGTSIRVNNFNRTPYKTHFCNVKRKKFQTKREQIH
jgi:hypothetical protein